MNMMNHPSISKYTNNPYKATSTLNFYNNINDVRVMGKSYIDKHYNPINIHDLMLCS